ncbi:hypothetical protein EDB85DRAFT_2165221 [Lactarius pseudohatsudake]|nr:hypothetical protein EDB85DRAFT_2165221 [Lactarius pseudohatsudake]
MPYHSVLNENWRTHRGEIRQIGATIRSPLCLGGSLPSYPFDALSATSADSDTGDPLCLNTHRQQTSLRLLQRHPPQSTVRQQLAVYQSPLLDTTFVLPPSHPSTQGSSTPTLETPASEYSLTQTPTPTRLSGYCGGVLSTVRSVQMTFVDVPEPDILKTAARQLTIPQSPLLNAAFVLPPQHPSIQGPTTLGDFEYSPTPLAARFHPSIVTSTTDVCLT